MSRGPPSIFVAAAAGDGAAVVAGVGLPTKGKSWHHVEISELSCKDVPAEGRVAEGAAGVLWSRVDTSGDDRLTLLESSKLTSSTAAMCRSAMVLEPLEEVIFAVGSVEVGGTAGSQSRLELRPESARLDLGNFPAVGKCAGAAVGKDATGGAEERRVARGCNLERE